MNKVIVYSDSTIDLNSEIYQQRDIHIIPLIVNLDGVDHYDGIDITQEDLYASVAKTGKLPTTAAVGPERIHEAFAP